MNRTATLRRFLSKPGFAAASYLCVMILLLFVIGSSFTDVLNRRADVASSWAMFEQFDGRKAAAAGRRGPGDGGPAGSPFLEGATVTIAGAGLLQRVTAAVTKLGGNVLSSQIDLPGAQSRAGFLSIIASCDIDQGGLQRLLYDIEAGQPFLFVDQLSVQAPASFASSGEGRLRVLLSVSGQWRGTK